jgi:hypothetical protein
MLQALSGVGWRIGGERRGSTTRPPSRPSPSAASAWTPAARTVLAAAPDPRRRPPDPCPAAGRPAQIRTAAEHRGMGGKAAHHFHRRLPAPAAARRADYGAATLALVAQLDAGCRAADDLAEAPAKAFAGLPDAELLGSFPGSGHSPAHASWPRSVKTAPAQASVFEAKDEGRRTVHSSPLSRTACSPGRCRLPESKQRGYAALGSLGSMPSRLSCVCPRCSRSSC